MPKYNSKCIDEHKILTIDILSHSEIIEKVEEQAKLKAANVNPADPAGENRELPVKLSQNFLGVLADTICAMILKDYFQKYNLNIKVERYDDVRDDNFKNHDLYDIRLFTDTFEMIVEVRSSVCNLLSEKGMIDRFHILGPYKTDVKGDSETNKALYMRILFHFTKYEENRRTKIYSLSDGMKHFKEGNLRVYFVGGATCDMLNGLGSDRKDVDLKQGEAVFTVLDIKKGLDASKFLETVRDMMLQSEKIK